MIIVSDLLPMVDTDKNVAPHNGAFSKVLSKYVRDLKLIDLPTAIAKMTWLPAKRLENYAPAFKNKGRIQVGADADITIFDMASLESKATYQDPYQEAKGFQFVIVNGQPVISYGLFLDNTHPGKRLLAK